MHGISRNACSFVCMAAMKELQIQLLSYWYFQQTRLKLIIRDHDLTDSISNCQLLHMNQKLEATSKPDASRFSYNTIEDLLFI